MQGTNKAILIGHLGRKPELRRTPHGDGVVSFSLATSESWRDKVSGERCERTQWHNVVVFNEALVAFAAQNLKKGSKVYVEGKLRSRPLPDKEGARITEIVLDRYGGTLFCFDRQERVAPDPDAYGYTSARGSHAAPRARQTAGSLDDPRMAMAERRPAPLDDFGDDIPF